MNKAQEIKKALKQEGRSMVWLSVKSGIPYGTLNGYCCGKEIKEPAVRLIAYTLGLPPSFFGLAEQEVNQEQTLTKRQSRKGA